MEQKTNPGQQAEPQEAPQSTPWIDKVKELADTIGKELDETQGRRPSDAPPGRQSEI